MVEIPDAVLCGTEPVRSVDDDLRFVVQPFYRSVVDRHPEVVEDVIFVATHHPSEVAHRGKSGMRCPPEPLLEVLLRPSRSMVVPEVPEEFFEEIGPVDLEVKPLELTESQRLVLGKVPRVLQPDEPRLVH